MFSIIYIPLYVNYMCICYLSRSVTVLYVSVHPHVQQYKLYVNMCVCMRMLGQAVRTSGKHMEREQCYVT